MCDILLVTLNAKYIHAAFGLRYLLANLGALQARTTLLEFDIHQRPIDVAEALLSHNPRVIGLGVYIWNVTQMTELVAILKRLRPAVRIIVGGPEVSYEVESQAIVQLADHVITGEADLAFAELCHTLVETATTPPKIIHASPPDLAKVALPYSLYNADDLLHRVVYVESSRGCPFTCAFCLSALEIPLRQTPLPEFLAALDDLLERGATALKFVDRTFNINLARCKAILEFCLSRWKPGRFFHFEMIPDRLPAELHSLIAAFPSGAIQFEVGLQTFDAATTRRIGRPQNYARIEDNLRWLRAHTGVHLHADLIVGLPGESVESFGAGFDRLITLHPHEIQVGILKRLRGTPIVRQEAEWDMVYSPQPPYEILENSLINFATMQRLRRFARYWDLVGNSGNFVETTPLIWRETSPFYGFLRWSDWLFEQVGRTSSIALDRLAALLFRYLTEALGQVDTDVVAALAVDFQRNGRSLEFLRPQRDGQRAAHTGQKRQARHGSPKL